MIFSRMVSDPNVRRIFRFILVGGLNTLFGLTVYSVLVWFGLAPHVALAVSYVVGIFWNYNTHVRLVFFSRGYWKIVPYAMAYVAVFGLNSFALAELLERDVGKILSQAILAPFAAVLSFILISLVLTGRIGVKVD